MSQSKRSSGLNGDPRQFNSNKEESFYISANHLSNVLVLVVSLVRVVLVFSDKRTLRPQWRDLYNKKSIKYTAISIRTR